MTYADVWEFWLKHPEIADAVDFVTIHTLPYWEDDPVGDRRSGPARRRHRRRRSSATFPGKRLLVGEAGWPSAGRMREGARPSRVNQARFVRELIVAAEEAGIGLNLIEAFDQPWKRRLEGTVGGHWGLFDANRIAEVPAQPGPCATTPTGGVTPSSPSLLGLALVLPVFMMGMRQKAADWILLATVSQVAGTCLVLAALQGSMPAQHLPVVGVGRTLAARAGGGGPVSVRLSEGEQRSTCGAAVDRRPGAVVRRSFLPPGRPRRCRWCGACFALSTAAVVMLCLVFDGRHRDFPIASYAVPALVFFVLAAVRQREHADDVAEERLLAAVLIAGSVVSPLIEGFGNWQALLWAAVCILLAAGVQLEARSSGWLGRRQSSGKGRTRRSAASSKAAAESSGA